jgi:hypothetical protein
VFVLVCVCVCVCAFATNFAAKTIHFPYMGIIYLGNYPRVDSAFSAVHCCVEPSLGVGHGLFLPNKVIL